MDIKRIEELAGIMQKFALTKLEVSDNTIVMEKTANAPIAVPQSSEAVAVEIEDDMIEVKSPIVGVFYSAAAPDSPPFVNIGSKVSKGDVLCIVEAMKLLNEITAEQDGEISDICLKNGDTAEFGQVLFKLKV